MKTRTWITAAAALTLIIGTVHAEEASRNVVGFARVDLAPGYNLVAYNWNAGTEDGRVSVQELFNTARMQASRSPRRADNLIFWDTGAQQYVTLWLGESGRWLDDEGIESSRTVGRGEAFWVVSRASEAMTQFVRGTLPSAESEVARTFGEGYTLFGRSFPVSTPVNELDWTGAVGARNPSRADSIIFWDVEQQRYVTLWRGLSGKWLDEAGVEASTVLPAGVGVWYVRRGGEGDFSWSETNAGAND